MPSAPMSFALPDLLAVCPFKGRTNPYYPKASEDSHKWLKSHKVFKDRKRAFFIQGENELLASYAYPYAGPEQVRGCCDFINLLFVLDEISDEQNGKDAIQTGLVAYRAMSDPDFDDGSVLCTMTKQVRERLLRHMLPNTFRRFVNHCRDYVAAVGKEAELRELGTVLDVEAFQDLRRANSAVWVCFGLFGYALGLDLPDEIHDHETISGLYLAAADMVCWSNDLYSYNMEQAMGHTGNNILTVLMKEKDIGLQDAADFVGEHFTALVNRFVELKAQLPSWGPEYDPAVAQYIMAMEDWVIGNLEWSFDVQRYFGVQRQKVAETLTVELYPKRS